MCCHFRQPKFYVVCASYGALNFDEGGRYYRGCGSVTDTKEGAFDPENHNTKG